MTIVRIESRVHRSAFGYGAGAASQGGNLRLRSMDTLLVRVETDDGLVGFGEGFGFTLVETTRDALDRLVAPACLGQDEADIAALMRTLERRFHNFGRNGPVTFALSAIDIALWDIAAQCAGRPLHALLGDAARPRVAAYASLLRYDDPDAVARNVREAVRRGFRAIKLHEVSLGGIRAARAAAPDDIPLMLDINCAWNTIDQARDFCRAVAGMNVRWVEEPTWPPEDFRAMAVLRRDGVVGISAGENLGNAHDFARLIGAGAVDVAQPSVTKHGGVSALREIGAMAREAGIAVVPHSPYFGPGLLATLHFLAAVPDAEPIEIYFADLDAAPHGAALAVREGFISVPTAPGLGLIPAW
jgi:L-alanine-DL-glutamate epimerase-like enolase superfamily enzyme